MFPEIFGPRSRPRRVTANIAELVADGRSARQAALSAIAASGLLKRTTLSSVAQKLYTAGTSSSGMRLDEVGQRGVSNGGKVETALRSAGRDGVGQHAINQASVGRSRSARGAGSARSARPKLAQVGGVAHGGIRRLIRNFSSVDGTNRAHCRRLVGCDTCTQQVRNGDGSDDQDDRHYDQQLDK